MTTTYTTEEAIEFELSRLTGKATTLRRLDGDSALGRGCGLHDIAKDIDTAVSNLRRLSKAQTTAGQSE